MVHVLASLRIKEGHLAEFLEIFKANVHHVLKEKGCIEYIPAIDLPTYISAQAVDQNMVSVIEKWESLAALKDHAVAAHMQAYEKKVKDILEGVSLKILA